MHSTDRGAPISNSEKQEVALTSVKSDKNSEVDGLLVSFLGN